MKRTTSFLLAASGFTILVAALVISIAQEAHAPDAKPVPVTNVLVTNTTAQPVPTDVANTVANPVPMVTAYPEPFQQKTDIPLPKGVSGGEAAIGVPSGKQLVVEHVSILLLIPTGQTAWARILIPF